MRPAYERQVQLLIRLLPHVATGQCFALKGGTAINLFVRDMPRLSVDIDLTYLPVAGRPKALADIQAALERIVARLIQQMPGVRITQKRTAEGLIGFQVNIPDAQVKVEVSPVLRGAVFPAVEMEVRQRVEERYGFAAALVVSFEDLYAGKFCAALDRQHPRDFFDVKLLLETGGLNRDVFRAFLVYLISHHRPMAELLAPNWKDIRSEFEGGFDGMTDEAVSVDELTQTGPFLLKELAKQFTDSDKEFLLSVKRGEPDWKLLDIESVEQLPAVQWKLQNVLKMKKQDRNQALARLESVLKEL